jgi:hypothetical protein
VVLRPQVILPPPELDHLGFSVRIKDLSAEDPAEDMIVDLDEMPAGKVVGGSPAIEDGGADYEVGDILTVVGGTRVRSATFRVTTVAAGVITGVQLVDPGDEYTVDPDLEGNEVEGGRIDDSLILRRDPPAHRKTAIVEEMHVAELTVVVVGAGADALMHVAV